MGVSSGADEEAPKGARARTRKLMLATATTLMQRGETPSVSAVAEAAEVSRATAYRYFPSQAALVQAVVEQALGPILSWKSSSADAATRVQSLIGSALPRILEFEATFKAALKLSLEQSAPKPDGSAEEVPFKRGKRIELLLQAIAPLRETLPEPEFQRLAKALSLVFGIEVLVILKDIWGLPFEEVEEIALWSAEALVASAMGRAGKPSGNRHRARKAKLSNASMSA